MKVTIENVKITFQKHRRRNNSPNIRDAELDPENELDYFVERTTREKRRRFIKFERSFNKRN